MRQLFIFISFTILPLSGFPKKGLVAHWNFESKADNAFSGVTAPLSNGSLQGDATTESLQPISGDYLQLDGDEDYVDIPKHPFFYDLSSGWSAAAWFHPSRAPTQNERFFIFETSGGASHISASLKEHPSDPTKTNVKVFTSNSKFIEFPIDDSKVTDWNHLLITWANDKKTLTIYLNGASVKSIRTSYFTGSFPDGFHIGTCRDANAHWFLGGIDEVTLWNRALTDQEALTFKPIESIVVTTIKDEDDGNLDSKNGDGTSLREAINHSSANDTITFDPSLKGQTITTLSDAGQFIMNHSLDIIASGDITIDAQNKHRIFMVTSGTTVNLHGLTLTAGRTKKGGHGGAIFVNSNSSLTLDTCTLLNNQTGNGVDGYSMIDDDGDGDDDGEGGIKNADHGGHGGAIFVASNSSLTLNVCTLRNNKTGRGGNGGRGAEDDDLDDAGTGGNGGYGGAIFTASDSTLTLNTCILSGNQTGNGGNGGSGYNSHSDNGGHGGRGGHGGDGGSIFTDFNSSFTINACTVTGNRTGYGGKGGDGGHSTDKRDAEDGGNGGQGGHGGNGGGICSDSSSASIMNASTINTNHSGSGGGGGKSGDGDDGYGDQGGGGRGGNGGGIFTKSRLTLHACTIIGNHPSDGKGSGGLGCGIFANSSKALHTGSTNGTRSILDIQLADSNNSTENSSESLTLNTCNVSGNYSGNGGNRGHRGKLPNRSNE